MAIIGQKVGIGTKEGVIVVGGTLRFSKKLSYFGLTQFWVKHKIFDENKSVQSLRNLGLELCDALLLYYYIR